MCVMKLFYFTVRSILSRLLPVSILQHLMSPFPSCSAKQLFQATGPEAFGGCKLLLLFLVSLQQLILRMKETISRQLATKADSYNWKAVDVA